jgi:hypothetical protein
MHCDIHGNTPYYTDLFPPGFGQGFIDTLPMPSLPPEFLEISANQNRNNANRNPGNFSQLWNPLLDGDRDTGIRYEPERIVPLPVPVPAQENIAVETLENNEVESVIQQDEIFDLEPQHLTQDGDPGSELEMPYNPLLD